MFVERFRTAYQLFIRFVVRLIAALVGQLEITGRENLPSTGPYVAVTNHLSKVDSALVLLALPPQRLRVFAARKWRPHPIFGPLLGLSGAIWVRRGEVDRRALGEAIAALRDGQVLGMAPEGTRSRTRVLQKARQGSAYLASRAQVPLLPIGISNSDLFRENILRLRRTHFQVRIGKPFCLPDIGHRPSGPELELYTDLIMGNIANLLPDHYHGYYAGSPVLSALREGRDAWLAAQSASRGTAASDAPTSGA